MIVFVMPYDQNNTEQRMCLLYKQEVAKAILTYSL